MTSFTDPTLPPQVDQPPAPGPPVPNVGQGDVPRVSIPRPPAVMGPSVGTNGRPPNLPGQVVRPSDGQTALAAGQNPNSPYRLPPPPPPPDFPETFPHRPPEPAPVPIAPGSPSTPPGAPTAAPGDPGQPQPVAPGVSTAPQRPQMVVGSTTEVPAGVEVDTQIGKAYKDPAVGSVAVTLNSAGKAGYQRALASQLQRFGSYYGSDDPNHPKPPIQLGVPMFNPDTGKWIS